MIPVRRSNGIILRNASLTLTVIPGELLAIFFAMADLCIDGSLRRQAVTICTGILECVTVFQHRYQLHQIATVYILYVVYILCA